MKNESPTTDIRGEKHLLHPILGPPHFIGTRLLGRASLFHQISVHSNTTRGENQTHPAIRLMSTRSGQRGASAR